MHTHLQTWQALSSLPSQASRLPAPAFTGACTHLHAFHPLLDGCQVGGHILKHGALQQRLQHTQHASGARDHDLHGILELGLCGAAAGELWRGGTRVWRQMGGWRQHTSKQEWPRNWMSKQPGKLCSTASSPRHRCCCCCRCCWRGPPPAASTSPETAQSRPPPGGTGSRCTQEGSRKAHRSSARSSDQGGCIAAAVISWCTAAAAVSCSCEVYQGQTEPSPPPLPPKAPHLCCFSMRSSTLSACRHM